MTTNIVKCSPLVFKIVEETGMKQIVCPIIHSGGVAVNPMARKLNYFLKHIILN